MVEIYEFDLILTDEDTMKTVCNIWMIHNEEATNVIINHEEKLIPKPQEEKMVAEEPQPTNGNGMEDNDSDLVICGEEESPEL